MTKDYGAGQAANVIVREDDGYDADRYGALYLRLGFLVVGMILMIWIGSAPPLDLGSLGMLFVVVLNGLAACATRPGALN